MIGKATVVFIALVALGTTNAFARTAQPSALALRSEAATSAKAADRDLDRDGARHHHHHRHHHRPSTSPAVTPPAAPPGGSQANCTFTTFPPFILHNTHKWQTVRPCAKATGIVVSVQRQSDGDFHVDIRPDPGSLWLLNAANMKALHGLLRAEIVPQRELGGVFGNTPLPPPSVGQHIEVVGAEVLDIGHAGWTEIHPVYSWRVI